MASATASSQSTGAIDLTPYSDKIDEATFEQILEMDDEGSLEFSTSIVSDFFAQAATTFSDMEEAIEKRDLVKISELGHFLKGSSAILGLIKVRDLCEKIQHTDEEAAKQPSKDKILKTAAEQVSEAKLDCKDVEKILRKFFEF